MSGPGETIDLLAPAKVNLYLEVLGQRPNGYHDIRSLVVPIDLCDRVRLEAAEGIETCIDAAGRIPAAGLDLARPEDNLATRAARLLQRETGCAGGVRIALRKDIPVGGGLGGGSADAAAVLVGLNRLWRLDLPRERLIAIGAQLGCDIPSLIHGGAVRMEGLGERVTGVATDWDGREAPFWAAVVNPGFSVPTGDIYGRYTAPLTSAPVPYSNVVRAFQEGDFGTVARGLFNGLQETVFRKYPLIAIVVEELQKAGAEGALLSGSGASSFGLARNREQACAVAGRVAAALGPSVWTCVAALLPDGVMVAHGPLEA